MGSFLSSSISASEISQQRPQPLVEDYEHNHDSLGRLSDSDRLGVAETIIVLDSKGDLVGGGATGLVERLESGDVVKTAWTGRPTEADCKAEIAIEARIYDRLGPHQRLVQLKHWSPASSTLTLEYMPHGTPKEYITKNGQDISPAQKRQWAAKAAKAIELLYTSTA